MTAAPGENDTGNVTSTFSILLKERYEIRQQGYVERGEKLGKQRQAFILKADLYDARFTWLSEALCRELEEHLSHHGGGYRNLRKRGMTAFFTTGRWKSQILVARRGKRRCWYFIIREEKNWRIKAGYWDDSGIVNKQAGIKRRKTVGNIHSICINAIFMHIKNEYTLYIQCF